MKPPKGFISHASLDKERFVVAFAKKLRERGIDVWLDIWEMLPGDRVVGKIFEEGIGGADFIIVVLSKNSIARPWVIAELEVAVVRKIEEGVRIIPVVIDSNCPIPEALKSNLRVTIKNLSDYDAEFDQIVRAVYGAYDKPPLGPRPPYVNSITSIIPGLESSDSLILKLACEEARKAHDASDTYIHTDQLWEKVKDFGIDLDTFVESLEVLDRSYFIKGIRSHTGQGWQYPIFKVTTYGFEEYAKAEISDYEATTRLVLARIVNENDQDNIAIARAINQPLVVVNHILDMFAQSGRLKVIKPMNTDGIYSIYNISPDLKRLLRNS